MFAYNFAGGNVFDAGPRGLHAAPGTTRTANKDGLGDAWAGARGLSRQSRQSFIPPSPGSAFTILARVKPSNTDTSQDSLLQLGHYVGSPDAEARHMVIHLNIVSAGDVYLAHNNTDFYTGGSRFSAGQYIDLAYIYSGGTLSTSSVALLINGVSQSLVKAGTLTAALDLFTDPISIASDNGAAREFRGNIDYIFGFDGALPATQIADIQADPWSIFEGEHIWIPVLAVASTLPTLSLPTYVPGSITSDGWKDRVSYTY